MTRKRIKRFGTTLAAALLVALGLIIGCGSDSSLQVNHIVQPDSYKVTIISDSEGEGGRIFTEDKSVFVNGVGSQEVRVAKSSGLILESKPLRGYRRGSWEVAPQSIAFRQSDGKIFVENVQSDMSIKMDFIKIEKVGLRVLFTNEKSPDRSNMVRWRAFYPDNKTTEPNDQRYCPRDFEEVRSLKCGPAYYPFGTRIEMESGANLTPSAPQTFVLEDDKDVLYEIGAPLYNP